MLVQAILIKQGITRKPNTYQQKDIKMGADYFSRTGLREVERRKIMRVMEKIEIIYKYEIVQEFSKRVLINTNNSYYLVGK